LKIHDGNVEKIMKKTIVFLDDDLNFLNGIKRVLRGMGEWDIITCVEADKVFQELARGNVDVVVSDYRMPEIDGLTVLGRIKTEYPSVHRVLLSGQVSDAVYNESLAVAERYLEKPCDAEMIYKVINELMGE
jgi:DNA-binding NtrC family response regulator